MSRFSTSHLPPLPATWPGALANFQDEYIFANNAQEEGDIRLRLAMFSSADERVRNTARNIVNAIGIPMFCPRPQCRRHGSCATKYVTCYFECRETIQQIIEAIQSGELDYRQHKENMRMESIRLNMRQHAGYR